jgi:hypothetical protein
METEEKLKKGRVIDASNYLLTAKEKVKFYRKMRIPCEYYLGKNEYEINKDQSKLWYFVSLKQPVLKSKVLGAILRYWDTKDTERQEGSISVERIKEEDIRIENELREDGIWPADV